MYQIQRKYICVPITESLKVAGNFCFSVRSRWTLQIDLLNTFTTLASDSEVRVLLRTITFTRMYSLKKRTLKYTMLSLCSTKAIELVGWVNFFFFFLQDILNMTPRCTLYSEKKSIHSLSAV